MSVERHTSCGCAQFPSEPSFTYISISSSPSFASLDRAHLTSYRYHTRKVACRLWVCSPPPPAVARDRLTIAETLPRPSPHPFPCSCHAAPFPPHTAHPSSFPSLSCFMTLACLAGARRHGTPAWAAWWEPPPSTPPAGCGPHHQRPCPRKPRSRGGPPKAPTTAEQSVFGVVVVVGGSKITALYILDLNSRCFMLT